GADEAHVGRPGPFSELPGEDEMRQQAVDADGDVEVARQARQVPADPAAGLDRDPRAERRQAAAAQRGADPLDRAVPRAGPHLAGDAVVPALVAELGATAIGAGVDRVA